MADISNTSTQERKMSEIQESATTTPRQGGENDDSSYEQEAIPPGRYLTGLRLALVCTRSVVLLALQFRRLMSKFRAHLSYAPKPLHLHFPGDGRDFHRQHLPGHHLGRLERL